MSREYDFMFDIALFGEKNVGTNSIAQLFNMYSNATRFKSPYSKTYEGIIGVNGSNVRLEIDSYNRLDGLKRDW